MPEDIKIFLLTFVLGLASLVFLAGYMTWMPGTQLLSDDAEIPQEIGELRERLKAHVEQLSQSSSGRNDFREDHLTPARDYITEQFKALGLEPRFQHYELDGGDYSNIIIEIPSNKQNSPVLIVGAHYDSVLNSPGANDNASGVAALIEIGRYFSQHSPDKYHLRLIAFTNEEPPYFRTESMGSHVYTSSLPASEDILGMIALETIGYYTDRPGSQYYPWPFKHFYPDTGNFVAFVGNLRSRALVTSSISLFRENSTVPSEGVAAPAFVPGVDWSDHWAFWASGHKAIMVTDTAPYRYVHYHRYSDTPDKLNYEVYAKVVHGLCKMVEGLLEQGVE